jgi:hypothetical protein
MAFTPHQYLDIIVETIRVQLENGGDFNLITKADIIKSIDDLDAYLTTNASSINNEFAPLSKTNLTVSAKNALFTGVSKAKFG